jgi:hypothetical protein
MPRNLVQEHNFAWESQLPMNGSFQTDLDFGWWQRDTNKSLLTLSHESYNFGSLAGNFFWPTEEENHVSMGSSSLHRKKILNTRQQFLQKLCMHKATEALAIYYATYDFQFYPLFQGNKTNAKRNAMINIFACAFLSLPGWAQLRLLLPQATSGAPMPKKQQHLKTKSPATKVAKVAKAKRQNIVLMGYNSILHKAKVFLMPNKAITCKTKVI